MTLQSLYADNEPELVLSTVSPLDADRSPGTPWSAKADDMLRALWPHVQAKRTTAQYAANQINALFGTSYSRSALLGRAFRLGMSEPVATVERPKLYAMEALQALSTERLCRFPTGHTDEPGFRFCGAPVVAYGKPYCKACSAKAYQKPMPPKERAHGKITVMELRRRIGSA